MWERHSIKISRETPYKRAEHRRVAALVAFVSPKEDVLGEQLRARYPWLQAEVLSSVGVEGVATRAAEVIVGCCAGERPGSRKTRSPSVGQAATQPGWWRSGWPVC
jgi:hypothetical protein